MKAWVSKAALLATGFSLGFNTLVGPPFVPGAAASAASAESPTNETRHWFPFTPVRDEFQETVLDGSAWVEAPTGQHGFVTVKGERFVFEDGTPVRFWGAQMSLWGKEQVDYAVRRMRRQGINITRLHGLGNLGKGPTSFERLDYLLAKLGENGIYIVLDLHYPLTHRFQAGGWRTSLPPGSTSDTATTRGSERRGR